MKDKFGIEICGDNCTGDLIPSHDCPKRGQKQCGKKNCEYFMPKPKLLKARLLELQEELRAKLKQKRMLKENKQLDYNPIDYDWQDCCNYCVFRNRCIIYNRLKTYNNSNITYDFSILEQGLKCNDYKLDEKIKEKYNESKQSKV